MAVRLTGEEPTINRNLDDVQWVQRFGAEPNAVYVFGRIDQSTVGLTSRLELAFTPTLSLQLYAQPFLSAGSYRDFRRVTDPKAEEYAESGDFRLGSNMSDLFATESRNVLMVSDPQAPPSVPLELPSSFHML